MARKTTYDEDKTKIVRNKVLEDIIEILNESSKAKRFGSFKKEMLLKLANTVLPRVQEISGKDGTPINIIFDKSFNATSSSSKEDSPESIKI